MLYYNDFNIALWILLQAPNLYYLHLTYYNIAEEVFGTNEVFVRNEMGESSYKFTVSNNGGKFLLLFILKNSWIIYMSYPTPRKDHDSLLRLSYVRF